MRADRLVAILLMLQRRGQVTAAEVAAELEVSDRTARRDLEALSMAGVPVYSRQGRNGGWQLLGGGRTDLSGLNAAEARALFLVAGPSSAATPQLKAALRKLVRALPEPLQPEAEAASSAVIVDPHPWGHSRAARPNPVHLEVLQAAVVQGQQVTLGYVGRDRRASERVVHPLGLAAKGESWYLVAETDKGLRTFRVDRVMSVEVLSQPVVRPDGFDLAEVWRLVTDRYDQHWVKARARGRATASGVSILRMILGNRVRIGPPGDDGRVEVEAGAVHYEALAAMVAGVGGEVEWLDPPKMRERLAALGRDLLELYGDVSSSAAT